MGQKPSKYRQPHKQSLREHSGESHRALAAANRYHHTGDLPSAMRAFLRYLKQHPLDADVLHTVGGIYHQLGDPTSAIDCLMRAIQTAPGNPDYHNDLGGVYLAEQKYTEAEACFRQALKLRPDYVQVRTNLGHTLLRAGRIEDAIVCFREVIAQRPDFADAHYNLGVVWQQSGQIERAAGAYEAAIRLQPKLVVAHCNLGQAYLTLRRNESAVECFRAALQHSPGYAEAMLGLGAALTEAWRVQEAIPWLREHLKHRADSIPGHLRLGKALEIAGDLTSAQASFRQALALAPQSAAVWHGLASVKKFSTDDRTDIDAMEALLKGAPLPEEGQCLLHFALGKAYDDCWDYDRAFEHYFAGNESKRKRLPLGSDRAQLTERIIEVFSADFFEQRDGIGSDSDLPILVLGMPRSGTTLTEQIISSHPDVHGAGELSYFGSVASGLNKLLRSSEPFPTASEAIDQSNYALIAKPYLKLLRWHSATARHVTDKMPGNYRYLGLIALLFPRAVIIHCERDALDTCLSIYFQHFARGHDYSYDLHAIAETYRQYRRLMAHWHQVLPGRIYTSNYEQLVSNPEQKARELIAACGLEWDDGCLAFHQSKREVRTASVAQVRQPIYTHSKQRWRNYEKHLGPLKEGFGRSC